MAETFTVTLHVNGTEPTLAAILSVDVTPAIEQAAPHILRSWMNAIAGATDETISLRVRDVAGIDARLSVTNVSADAINVIRTNERVTIMIDSAALSDLRSGNGTLLIRSR